MRPFLLHLSKPDPDMCNQRGSVSSFPSGKKLKSSCCFQSPCTGPWVGDQDVAVFCHRRTFWLLFIRFYFMSTLSKEHTREGKKVLQFIPRALVLSTEPKFQVSSLPRRDAHHSTYFLRGKVYGFLLNPLSTAPTIKTYTYFFGSFQGD